MRLRTGRARSPAAQQPLRSEALQRPGSPCNSWTILLTAVLGRVRSPAAVSGLGNRLATACENHLLHAPSGLGSICSPQALASLVPKTFQQRCSPLLVRQLTKLSPSMGCAHNFQQCQVSWLRIRLKGCVPWQVVMCTRGCVHLLDTHTIRW